MTPAIHSADAFVRFRLHNERVQGRVQLDGSKSISNRALIIMALIGADPALYLRHLSHSDDTQTLQRLLSDKYGPYDAGEAGTAYRFMTAFLALQPGEQTLTGSARMLERPIGPLVDALRTLGADINYLGRAGYPPLKIGDGWQMGLHRNVVRVNAGVSSQFLSALAMLGPLLPHGLAIHPEGEIASKPYLDMTLSLMHYMGAEWEWDGGVLHIASGSYRPKPLRIEADWSAASYWYAIAAFSKEADLTLEGLDAIGWQGDARMAEWAEDFGVHTAFTHEGVHLTKANMPEKPVLEYAFNDCPDLFPTLSVMCAGFGKKGLFSGLDSLRIKESDRILAMQTELAKVGVGLVQTNTTPGLQVALEGRSQWVETPLFDTWNDHRIAMSLAAFGMLGEVEIRNPKVVGKSYPNFWEDLTAVQQNSIK